jgi:tRNA nucleotidyltransferase (CCA-adding enzyme)
MSTYVVGGVPRDLVLNRPTSDLDIVVEGDAISIARAMAEKYGGRVTAHSRFLTAKWHFAGGSSVNARSGGVPRGASKSTSIDLISARIETYLHPAELPRVRLGSIVDDLRRRDFTINTLAVRVDEAHFGDFRDDFGALGDLQRGTIRVLHSLSFRDDPTRMYRAVRYEQRYAFHLDAKTLSLIADSRALVDRLSAHRIRSELDLILGEDRAAVMVERLANLGLLRTVHRYLPDDNVSLGGLKLADQTSTLSSPRPSLQTLRWLLWLAVLGHGQIQAIQTRLHFSGDLFAAMLASSRLRRDLSSLTRRKTSQAVAYLRRVPISSIHAVYRTAPSARARHVLENYLLDWRHVRSTVTGRDLRRLGLAPGPVYEYVLSDLRDARLDGLVRTKEEERVRLELLLERIRKAKSPGTLKRRYLPGK